MDEKGLDLGKSGCRRPRSLGDRLMSEWDETPAVYFFKTDNCSSGICLGYP